MTPTAPTTTGSVIRPATVDDVPAIVRMGLRFAEAEYARFLTRSPEQLAALARLVLTNPTGAGWVATADDVVVGMLGMSVYVHPMSGETIATEICWWMEPEVRGSRAALRLLDAGTAWARAQGAVRLQMIAPTAHVGAFYERLGFELLELHYQRAL